MKLGMAPSYVSSGNSSYDKYFLPLLWYLHGTALSDGNGDGWGGCVSLGKMALQRESLEKENTEQVPNMGQATLPCA